MTPCETPPALPDYARSVVDLRGDWFVSQVYDRKEKVVARSLRQQGIGYYLPTVRVSRIISGKKRPHDALVLPQYVFVCCADSSDYYALKETCHVMPNRILHDANQPRFVRELLAIERAVPHVADVMRSNGIYRGVVCRVKPGHKLGGLRGVVDWINGDTITISVSMLGEKTPLEIDACFLEVLEQAA